MKKKKIFQIDDAENSKLEDAAWAERISQAEFIRRAIDERIEKQFRLAWESE